MSFLNIRKTALVAAILNTIIVLGSFRTLLGTLDAVGKAGAKGSIVAVPLVALTVVSALLAVLFYFALSANKLPLKIAPELGRLALYAAIVFGIVTLAGLPSWIESLKQYLSSVGDPGFSWLALVVRLAGEASNLAYVALLILLWRAPAPEGSDPEVAGLLDVASRLSVMTLGLWLAFSLYQAGYSAYMASLYRDTIVARTRNESWPLQHWLTSTLPKLLTAACIFVAPYVVAMTQRMRPRPIASDADEPSAFLEPPVSPLDPQSP